MRSVTPHAALAVFLLALTAPPFEPAFGQEARAIEEVALTGSRIGRDPLHEPTAAKDLNRDDLVNTGFTSLGDALRDLIAGCAPNSQFNMPGSQGFPQDGAGIGAGSGRLWLRKLKTIRTLILMDGRRWIPGASASGEPEDKAHDNFTDPQSRIMRTSADGFQPCCNAQLAVEGANRLVVAAEVSANASGYAKAGARLQLPWSWGFPLQLVPTCAAVCRRVAFAPFGPQPRSVPEDGRVGFAAFDNTDHHCRIDSRNQSAARNRPTTSTVERAAPSAQYEVATA